MAQRKPALRSFGCAACLCATLLLAASCSADTQIHQKQDIEPKVLNSLVEAGVVADGDAVHYLYQQTGGSGSIGEQMLSDEARALTADKDAVSGALFTDLGVLTYHIAAPASQASVKRLALDAVTEMSFQPHQLGPDKAYTVISVTAQGGQRLDIALPGRNDDNEAFYRALRSAWEARPRVAERLRLGAAGEIPAAHPEYEGTLPEKVKQKLLDAGILLPDEAVGLFFAPDQVEFLREGYLFTPARVVAYSTDDASRQRIVKSARLADVSDIVSHQRIEEAPDGTRSFATDKHIQVFADNRFLFGFDDHDTSSDGLVEYSLLRQWAEVSAAPERYQRDLDSGALPPETPTSGASLSQRVVQGLIDGQVVSPGEKIVYFTTPHPRSYAQFGGIATDRRVIHYEVPVGGQARKTYAFGYGDVADIQLQKDEAGRDDSEIHVLMHNGVRLRLPAPTADGADDALYAAIATQWKAHRKTE